MTKEALILFSHGSSDPEWVKPFQRIQALVQEQRPYIRVELAFLEAIQPTLLATVDKLGDEGYSHITIAPLFLAPGAHIKRDLPQLVTQAQKMYPRLTIRLLPTLGESHSLLTSTATWISDQLRVKVRASARSTLVADQN